jgi:periplasmic copper chaperone A
MRQIASLILVVTLAACRPSVEGGIEIQDAWAGATPPGATVGAAYMVIITHEPDTLLSVATPVAEVVTIHTTLEEGGISKMRPLHEVDLAAQERFSFEPGAAHLMLIGLRAPLTAGSHFPLTLQFRRAGTQVIEVAVRSY